MRRLFLASIIALATLAGCGDDDTDSPIDTSEQTSDDTTDDTTTPEQPGADEDAAAPGGGGTPTGTVTIDGTDYTVVASLQCLVAIDEANQISISGDVEGNDSDDRVQWSYGWDSDDGVNDFTISVSPDLEYGTFAGAEFGEPQVDGQSVTVSGTVQPTAGAQVEASLTIDCAG